MAEPSVSVAASFAGASVLSRQAQYRWWPLPHADSLDFGGGGPTLLLRTLLAIALGCAVLSTPVCTRTTGLSIGATWTLGVGWGTCMVLNDFVLHPRALRSARWFNTQMAILLAYNGFFICAFPVVGNQPQTPLWMVALLWAGFTGTWQEMEPSWTFLAAHVLWPLATIPLFLARGADPHWAIAGPAIAAMVCGIAYDQTSMMTAAWRQTRRTQAAALATAHRQVLELQQQRLARELHDGVGAALALARTASDLFDLHAHSPEMLREVAAALRASSADALSELRVVLDVLAPPAGTPAGLAETLQRVAGQFAAASTLAVEVVATGSAPVPEAVQLAAVQIVRESLRNALQHGQARHATVAIAIAPTRLALTVTDDGMGFDPLQVTAGRGLGHLHARCAELAGSAEIRSGNDGTVIDCTLGFAAARSRP